MRRFAEGLSPRRYPLVLLGVVFLSGDSCQHDDHDALSGTEDLPWWSGLVVHEVFVRIDDRIATILTPGAPA